MVTVIVGGHFGDEGKGKILSYLCEKDKPDIVARGGVGPNAGHSVVIGDKTYGVRQMPSGFADLKARLLIGAGVLVDPKVLFSEIELLKDYNAGERLGVNYRCIIIEDEHKERDVASEHLKETVKTTGTGCGPANEDRVKRVAKRAEDIAELKPYIVDVAEEVNEGIKAGKKIILEGTQGFGLSIMYGTYPYVTTKDISASAICSDVGVGPTKVKEVIVIVKAYTTRVGGGPLATEDEKWAKKMGIAEFGTVTHRPRRIGKFDWELSKHSIMINGATQLAVTNLDRMFPEVAGVKAWDELSKPAQEHILLIQEKLGVPVTRIGTGPEVHDVIDLR